MTTRLVPGAPFPRCTMTSQKHRDARAVLDIIVGDGGTTSLSNRGIARALGISLRRFERARDHSEVCTRLEGFVIGHRGRRSGNTISVAQQTNTATIASVADRWRSLRSGEDAIARMVQTHMETMANLFTAVQREADAKGYPGMVTVLQYVLDDLRRDARIHPATWLLLESELAKVS